MELTIDIARSRLILDELGVGSEDHPKRVAPEKMTTLLRQPVEWA